MNEMTLTASKSCSVDSLVAVSSGDNDWRLVDDEDVIGAVCSLRGGVGGGGGLLERGRGADKLNDTSGPGAVRTGVRVPCPPVGAVPRSLAPRSAATCSLSTSLPHSGPATAPAAARVVFSSLSSTLLKKISCRFASLIVVTRSINGTIS